uniref:Uncharacterized protein n=1 Tax=Anguilla anguilla TaxID=7936 RepID=A0A0E9TU16_ANGAN
MTKSNSHSNTKYLLIALLACVF